MAVVIRVRTITRKVPEEFILGRTTALNEIGRDVFHKGIAAQLKKGIAPADGTPNKKVKRLNPNSESARVLLATWAGVNANRRLGLGFIDAIKDKQRRQRAIARGEVPAQRDLPKNRERRGGYTWATKVSKAQAQRWLREPTGIGPAKSFITPGALRSEYAREGTRETVTTLRNPKGTRRSGAGREARTSGLTQIQRYMQARGYSLLGTDAGLIKRANAQAARIIAARRARAVQAQKPVVSGA